MPNDRPATLGRTLQLTSTIDVDAALHEMSWLTMRQRSIEADAKALIEDVKLKTDQQLVCEVDGESMTIRDRWDALQKAVFAWAKKGLAKALPANKKSLKLSHGELKTRSLPAAVVMLEGKKAEDAAVAIAREGGLMQQLDTLLEAKVHGTQLGQLIAVQVTLNKDGIKANFDPETKAKLHEFLQGLAISVEAGQQQVTIVPADLKVSADSE